MIILIVDQDHGWARISSVPKVLAAGFAVGRTADYPRGMDVQENVGDFVQWARRVVTELSTPDNDVDDEHNSLTCANVYCQAKYL